MSTQYLLSSNVYTVKKKKKTKFQYFSTTFVSAPCLKVFGLHCSGHHHVIVKSTPKKGATGDFFFSFLKKRKRTIFSYQKQKLGEKKIAAVRLASILATRWTGNRLFSGQPGDQTFNIKFYRIWCHMFRVPIFRECLGSFQAASARVYNSEMESLGVWPCWEKESELKLIVNWR